MQTIGKHTADIRGILTCCFVVAVVCGCAHVHHLDSLSDKEATSFEERANTMSFKVWMYGGRAFDGTHLAVETDSIAWNDAESGERVRVATREVQKIVFFSRATGFADGFVTGFAVGGLIGGIIGYSGGEDDCSNNSDGFCVSRRGLAFFGVMVVGLTAGVIGGLASSAKGSAHVYYPASDEKETESTQSSLSRQPPHKPAGSPHE